MASTESVPDVLDENAKKEGESNDVEKIKPLPAQARNNDKDIERIATQEKPLVDRPSPRRWFLTCVGLYLGALVYGLDTTIAADVQASAYESLGELQKLPWIGAGFPLGSVGIILLVGKLYGMFEIKKLIIGFILLFEIGSALCGAAPNASALIVGRVIAGMGGAGMYIGALNYISVFTSLRERPIYNALIGLCWGVGAILGPAVGGGFAVSNATWRWAFYINLPLAAVVAPIYFFVFPNHCAEPDLPTGLKLKQIDWVGALLNATTFSIFLIVCTFAGSTWKWNSGPSISLWIIFGVVLVLYCIQQVFCIFTTPKRRLFPVQFAKSRTFLLMYFTTASAATATSVAIYYIPLFFQFTKGDSALKAAVRLLPLIITYVASVMFAGGLLPIVGRYAPWYYPAGILVTIGGALMYTISSTTQTAAIYGFEVLIAVGSGLIFQTAYSVVAAKVDAHKVPDAIGFINVAQIGSIAISLSIAGSIFQNLGYSLLRDALAGYNFPEAELRSALAGAQSAVLWQAGPGAQVRDLATESIAKTIAHLFGLVIASGAVILASALFMRWEKLSLYPAAGACRKRRLGNGWNSGVAEEGPRRLGFCHTRESRIRSSVISQQSRRIRAFFKKTGIRKIDYVQMNSYTSNNVLYILFTRTGS